jgi:hypothetical protein
MDKLPYILYRIVWLKKMKIKKNKVKFSDFNSFHHYLHIINIYLILYFIRGVFIEL